MKKLFLFLIPFLFLFMACEEDEDTVPVQYCAQCVEVNTNYAADLFCSNQDAVNAYVLELTTWDPMYPDQDWYCETYINQ